MLLGHVGEGEQVLGRARAARLGLDQRGDGDVVAAFGPVHVAPRHAREADGSVVGEHLAHRVEHAGLVQHIVRQRRFERVADGVFNVGEAGVCGPAVGGEHLLGAVDDEQRSRDRGDDALLELLEARELLVDRAQLAVAGLEVGVEELQFLVGRLELLLACLQLLVADLELGVEVLDLARAPLELGRARLHLGAQRAHEQEDGQDTDQDRREPKQHGGLYSQCRGRRHRRRRRHCRRGRQECADKVWSHHKRSSVLRYTCQRVSTGSNAASSSGRSFSDLPRTRYPPGTRP